MLEEVSKQQRGGCVLSRTLCRRVPALPTADALGHLAGIPKPQGFSIRRP